MYVLGLNAKTFINTAADLSTPTWVEVQLMKDETLNLETALSDVTTRKAAGWRQQAGTLSEASIDGQLQWDTADAQNELIRAAFFDKSIIEMGFFDGDPATPPAAPDYVQGLQGGFSVTNFSQNRELEEAITIDVTYTVREDKLGNPPTWQRQQAP